MERGLEKAELKQRPGMMASGPAMQGYPWQDWSRDRVETNFAHQALAWGYRQLLTVSAAIGFELARTPRAFLHFPTEAHLTAVMSHLRTRSCSEDHLLH